MGTVKCGLCGTWHAGPCLLEGSFSSVEFWGCVRSLARLQLSLLDASLEARAKMPAGNVTLTRAEYDALLAQIAKAVSAEILSTTLEGLEARRAEQEKAG